MKIVKQLVWMAPLGLLIAGCAAPVHEDSTVAQWQREYQLPPTGRTTERVYANSQTQVSPNKPKIVVDPGREEGAAGDRELADSIWQRFEFGQDLAMVNVQSPVIVVRDGGVTIRGRVNSDVDAQMAEDNLREIPGVASVKNELEIGSGW